MCLGTAGLAKGWQELGWGSSHARFHHRQAWLVGAAVACDHLARGGPQDCAGVPCYLLLTRRQQATPVLSVWAQPALLKAVKDLAGAAAICAFTTNKLGLSERQLRTVTWLEVAHGTVQVCCFSLMAMLQLRPACMLKPAVLSAHALQTCVKASVNIAGSVSGSMQDALLASPAMAHTHSNTALHELPAAQAGECSARGFLSFRAQ